ncbi:homoserine kinase [Levilactobacillus bambusae]|uniref:Homoserine kinase n=1 Tax=Levilactobacillus bambusae TaxID=2024736 RepID=A0A2V1MWA4_9LACO|nr:homoserine kinase [Levilactobacillus bambusae]PWF99356.1 homoserine kinase [Levilactobacillus bambusae]
MGKIIIRVPATSANFGPGYGSIGLALHLYLTVIIEEVTETWHVNHALGDGIPTDEHNLIVQTALRINQNLVPHQLTIMSDIPIYRGLGSSMSAIIAGIKVANALTEHDYTLQEQMDLAAKLEGHADNAGAALLGSAVVSDFDGTDAHAVKLPFPDEIQALAFIRAQGVDQKAKDEATPKTLPFEEAVETSGAANMLVAALETGQWAIASRMIERDNFHEKALADLVPELDMIREKAHELNIYGTYLSGNGPTVITLGTEPQLTQLRQKINMLDLPGSIRRLTIDRDGATTINE